MENITIFVNLVCARSSFLGWRYKENHRFKVLRKGNENKPFSKTDFVYRLKGQLRIMEFNVSTNRLKHIRTI